MRQRLWCSPDCGSCDPVRTPDAEACMSWRARRFMSGGLVFAVLLTAGAAYGAYRYNRQQDVKAEVTALTGGDPDLGPELMTRYGCAGCHTIPGVRTATGRVGPPLRQVAGRVYLGGVLTNRPDHL